MFSKICPYCGLNRPRLLLATIAGFAFMFGFDYFVNAVLLMDLYEQTPQLWRSEASMGETFPWMLAAQIVTVLLTAFIFTRNYEAKGIEEGARFGLLLGCVLGVLMAESYVWMPISGTLAAAWFVSGLLKGIGLGLIYALTYRK